MKFFMVCLFLGVVAECNAHGADEIGDDGHVVDVWLSAGYTDDLYEPEQRSVHTVSIGMADIAPLFT